MVKAFPRRRERKRKGKRKKEKKKEGKKGRDVTHVRFYLGKAAWMMVRGGECIYAVGRQGRRKLPGGFEHEPIGGMGLKRPRSRAS